jgi:ribosomal protein S27AE
MATIPAEREFCGKCHSQDSQIKELPKVDLATHGEKYLCWQCHYPHMPEVE